MIAQLAATEFASYTTLASGEIADADALGGEIEAAITDVKRERESLGQLLGKVYLPELSEVALMAAQRLSGFQGYASRKPLEAMAKEERRLTERVATLDADERWITREGLVGAQGTWTRALAEARDLLDLWEKDAARFEDQEVFTELVALGYDTDAFAERWWQPQYWRHWQAGDRICAALGLDDFGDNVLPAYEAARVPRDKWRAEVARIQGNITDVHNHVQAHDKAAWRLANLADIYLTECQEVLAQHLQQADVGLLATWAGDDRGIAVHLKRLSGLNAKLDMLAEMNTAWLKPNRAALETARLKYAAKATKLARPKKAGLEVLMPDAVPEKLAAQRARRQKARSYVQRIVRYDSYDSFDLAQPPETWWLHMHNGHRPGLFTPGLRTWYDRHPDVVVYTDPNWEENRGDPLAATGALAGLGDIS